MVRNMDKSLTKSCLIRRKGLLNIIPLLVNTSRQLMLMVGFTKVPPSRSDPGDAVAAPRPSLPHLRSGRKMAPEPGKMGMSSTFKWESNL